MTAGHKWRPLQRTTTLKPASEELVTAYMQHFTCDRETALAHMKRELEGIE